MLQTGRECSAILTYHFDIIKFGDSIQNKNLLHEKVKFESIKSAKISTSDDKINNMDHRMVASNPEVTTVSYLFTKRLKKLHCFCFNAMWSA